MAIAKTRMFLFPAINYEFPALQVFLTEGSYIKSRTNSVEQMGKEQELIRCHQRCVYSGTGDFSDKYQIFSYARAIRQVR